MLLDGLNYDAACAHMGYMLHLTENKIAGFYKVNAELPTLSQPLYEVLMTGTPCIANGITNNFTIRRS